MSAPTTTRLQRLARIAAITAASMLAVAVSAGAQPATQPPTTTTVFGEGSWTVTPFIGVGFSGDLDSPTGAFGVAGGYMWNERVALEGEFNRLPSSEASGFVEVDTKVWSLTGNILYHFAGRSYVPYGVFGIGVGHGSVDEESNDPLLNSLQMESTEFVVNFGGGVERKLREKVAFRGDLRYFFGGNLVPDYWRFAVGITYNFLRP